jgi:PAS domain-containing protein
MSVDEARLEALVDVVPVGVIIIDAEGCVQRWNGRAEEFISCVGRPTLFVGMTLDEAHEGSSRQGMQAMVARLREGREFPCKRVSGGTREFKVWYRALFDEAGEYLGVAQIIEFLNEEDAA